MIIKGKAIVVYAKKDNELYFFKIYDYVKEDEAWQKFKELFSDDSLEAYAMTIDNFNKLI